MTPNTRIDVHMHYMGDTDISRSLLESLDLKMMNICVAEDADGKWRDQADVYRNLAHCYPDRFAWCTSFDLPKFEDADYIKRVIEGLERDFRDGAIACKIWKNVGMGLRNPSGDHVLVDDPILEPIVRFIEAQGKTLLMHIADPLDGWLPLDPSSVHYGYYSKNLEWHLYGRTDMPTHRQLMDARDNVIARHPNLRVVGAHLGSLEHDVNEVARRFDKYPNFAVDVSARLYDLATQDVSLVREFFNNYQDRILFGIDCGTWELASAKSPEQMANTMKYITKEYSDYSAYLESEGAVTLRDRELPALNLPADILDKVYRDNAKRWYPGIVS